MKGYGLFYFISEAFRGLRANGIVNLLAVGTISMAMLIVGFFLLLFLNLRPAVAALSDRLGMSVYLKDGLTDHEKDFLLSRIKAEPGAKKVAYLSRADALELFKKELKGQEALMQGLGENPLPDSYEISIDQRYADAAKIEAMARRISAYRGVEDVAYGKEGAAALSGLYKLTTYGGAALAVLLGVTVVFIISNSVRLALYSRGQEIELMQWIGATKGFIQGPFLIEGMMLAMLGTALAVGILAGVFYSLPREVVAFLSRPRGPDFLPPSMILSMIVGGGLLGLMGGLVSVSRVVE
ncbi:MAG TPA: permease-like cell division protein FtsX [Nitrospirota bacterium]